MPDLKLIALDTDDLQVLSAHLQDAVVRVGDMVYRPREKRFVAVTNRFDWDQAVTPAAPARRGGKRQTGLERRRTGLRFERVLAAKVTGFDLKDKRATLALLAITFVPAKRPAAADLETGADAPRPATDGDVTLTFSGGAAIRLTVECLEAEMKDLGAAWSTKRTPVHPDDSV